MKYIKKVYIVLYILMSCSVFSQSSSDINSHMPSHLAPLDASNNDVNGHDFTLCMLDCMDAYYLEADAELVARGVYTQDRIDELRLAIREPNYTYQDQQFFTIVGAAFWTGVIGVIHFLFMVLANLAAVFVVLRSVVALTIYYALGPYVLVFSLFMTNENILSRYWMYVMGIRLWPMLTVVVNTVISQIPFFKHPDFSGSMGGVVLPFLSLMLDYTALASMWAVPSYASVLVYYTSGIAGRDLGKSITKAAGGDRGAMGFGKMIAGNTLGRMYNKFQYGSFERGRHHNLFSDRRNPDAQQGRDFGSRTKYGRLAQMQTGAAKFIAGNTLGRMKNLVTTGSFSRGYNTKFTHPSQTKGGSLSDYLSRVGASSDKLPNLLSGSDTAVGRKNNEHIQALRTQGKGGDAAKSPSGDSSKQQKQTTANVNSKVSAADASAKGLRSAQRMDSRDISRGSAIAQQSSKEKSVSGKRQEINQSTWRKNEKGEWEKSQATETEKTLRQDSKERGDDALQGRANTRTTEQQAKLDTISKEKEQKERKEAVKGIARKGILQEARERKSQEGKQERKEQFDKQVEEKKTDALNDNSGTQEASKRWLASYAPDTLAGKDGAKKEGDKEAKQDKKEEQTTALDSKETPENKDEKVSWKQAMMSAFNSNSAFDGSQGGSESGEFHATESSIDAGDMIGVGDKGKADADKRNQETDADDDVDDED